MLRWQIAVENQQRTVWRGRREIEERPTWAGEVVLEGRASFRSKGAWWIDDGGPLLKEWLSTQQELISWTKKKEWTLPQQGEGREMAKGVKPFTTS